MKLRNFLVLIFILVALVPSLLFWAWPFSKALDSEINGVNERHLVIAKNLAMAFERYYKDVTSAFTVLSSQLGESEKNPTIHKLLDVYNFQSVMLVSRDTGQVQDCITGPNETCPETIKPDILNIAKTFLGKCHGTPKISTVIENSTFENNSMLLVTLPMGDNFALGYLSTRYIVALGKRVAFGKKGHAAIVDQAGNVMAHPLKAWIKEQKSMAENSVVKKMIAGETGVATFISPAFFNEMIAGYAAVPNAGWGVMVPQPIDELYSKADAIDRTALFVMLLGLAAALLVAIPVSFIITKPLERLSRATRRFGKKENLDVNLEMPHSQPLLLEVRKLNENFRAMTGQLTESRKSIARLAYMDINTGLPNRNYFQKLTRSALQELADSKANGAILFIDFDGFKQINDTYGHRAGDELLALFAKKLMVHFSLWDDTDTNDSWLDDETLPDVIPARLGGDEFVVLFKDIQDKADIKKRVEALLLDVFGEYELYGGIELTLSGSSGVALFPQHGRTYEEIIKAADLAMYAAKARGKNSLSFFTAEMNTDTNS